VIFIKFLSVYGMAKINQYTYSKHEKNHLPKIFDFIAHYIKFSYRCDIKLRNDSKYYCANYFRIIASIETVQKKHL